MNLYRTYLRWLRELAVGVPRDGRLLDADDYFFGTMMTVAFVGLLITCTVVVYLVVT